MYPKFSSLDPDYGPFDNEAAALAVMEKTGKNGRQVAIYRNKTQGIISIFTYNSTTKSLTSILDSIQINDLLFDKVDKANGKDLVDNILISKLSNLYSKDQIDEKNIDLENSINNINLSKVDKELDKSLVLNSQIQKLEELNTQSQLDTKFQESKNYTDSKVSQTVSETIPIEGTVLKRGIDIPEYITTVGKTELYGGTGGTTYTNTGRPAPNNQFVVQEGYVATAFYTKSTDSWSLGTSAELPTVDTSGLVAKNDINVQAISINKFNYKTVENGYIDLINGVDRPNTGGLIYNRTAEINVLLNTSGKMAISGYGNTHYGVGWRVTNIAGEILMNGVAGQNQTSFIIDYTSVLADAANFKCTVKTAHPSDNTNLEDVMIQFGGQITAFDEYENISLDIYGSGFMAKDIEGKKSIPSKNKFDKTKVVDGYIHLTSGAVINDPTYKKSGKTFIQNNNSKVLTISGLGTLHYGLGWRLNDPQGVRIANGVSPNNVTKFSVDYTAYNNVDSIEFTVITAHPDDNTDINNIQVEFGDIPTNYEPYSIILSEILGNKILAYKAQKADTPVADDDIVTLGYVKQLGITQKIKGKLVFALADSITEDTNSWIRQAIPLMGGTLVNFARSGARAGDHPTTAINLSPAVPINSPDNVLSNQVRRAAQSTTPVGQEITWTHPVTAEVFGVPISIGTGTGTRTAPDIILISISTNDTLYDDGFSTVKDVALSTLPNVQLVGGLRWAVENLMILYPNAQIIICTPIQSQPNGSRPFNVTKVKRDRVVEVANYYSLEIIDAFYDSGINEKFEIAGNGRYLSDGLHPNDSGKAKMRDFLINELNEKVVVKRS